MDLSRGTIRGITGALVALAVVAFITLGDASGGAGEESRGRASIRTAATPIASPVVAKSSVGTPVGSVVLSVDIRDDDYEPGGLRVSVGDRVRWVNRDGVTHTVSANDDSFDSGPMHRGGAFAHTFVEPGTYRYSCDLHLEMSGAVVVREG